MRLVHRTDTSLTSQCIGVALLLALAGCGPRAGEVNAGLEELQKQKGFAKIASPELDKPITKENQAAWLQTAELNFDEAVRAAQAAKANAPATLETPPANEQQQAIKAAEVTTDVNTGLVSVTRTGTGSTAPVPNEKPATDSQPAVQSTETKTALPNNSPLVDLAAKMASLLRQTDASGKPLLTDAAALTPIEAMKPGVLASLANTSINAKHPLFNLNAPDRETLANARERLLNNPEGVPEQLIKSLRTPPGDFADIGPQLALSDMALCTRVDGFARYEPYASTTFVAGKPIRAIVYTQVANFSSRPARDSDPVQRNVSTSEQVSVDLTQALSLYHDQDGLLVWQRPAQTVIETSRAKRNDFYLVQQIELPRSITIGRYNLKAIVTDRTTGAQAERIVPIEVVAEAVR